MKASLRHTASHAWATSLLVLLASACGDPDQTSATKSVPDAQSGVDASTSDAAQDGNVADSVAPDATQPDAEKPDAPATQNPNVALIRELSFEQPPGTNGWADPAEVVFNWSKHPTGRDKVPDAFVRGAGGINVPSVASGIAYKGKQSTLFTMLPWSNASSFRTDLEMVGNASLPRTFPHGKTQVVGFAMRIEHSSYSGSFQLYHQYHNGAPKKPGYGVVANPALSLLRVNDTDLAIAVRSNLPNGKREDTTFSMPNTVRAGQWVRWVFKTRFENHDSGKNALVEVYSAVGNEPLTMHLRVDDRPMGYVYENPAHSYEVVIFDLYGSPQDPNAKMYLDEVRIVAGDHPAAAVDPISWVSYQHPLNQAYDPDLAP